MEKSCQDDAKEDRIVKAYIMFFSTLYWTVGVIYGLFRVVESNCMILMAIESPKKFSLFAYVYIVLVFCTIISVFSSLYLMWSRYEQKKYDEAVLFSLLPLLVVGAQITGHKHIHKIHTSLFNFRLKNN